MVGISAGSRLTLAALVAATGLAVPRAAPARVALQRSRPLIRSQLLWLDRAGKRLGVLGTPADYGDLEMAPDGTRVGVAVLDPAHGTRDIWMYDVASGRRTAFTSNAADENWLLWAPDGARVVFNSQRGGQLDLYQAPSVGGSAGEILLSDADAKWPMSWSPDGRHILFVTDSRETGNDIWVLPMSEKERPFPYLHGRFAENWPAFSPDGRWVAFSSAASGQPEVYVASFPMPGRQWLVSTAGGTQARWRRDGRELFYAALDRTLMAASVVGKGTDFQASTPEPLFEMHYPYGQYHAYDITSDGQRLLVNTLIPLAGAPVVAHRADRADRADRAH